jgi:hypothetical protein
VTPVHPAREKQQERRIVALTYALGPCWARCGRTTTHALETLVIRRGADGRRGSNYWRRKGLYCLACAQREWDAMP